MTDFALAAIAVQFIAWSWAKSRLLTTLHLSQLNALLSSPWPSTGFYFGGIIYIALVLALRFRLPRPGFAPIASACVKLVGLAVLVSCAAVLPRFHAGLLDGLPTDVAIVFLPLFAASSLVAFRARANGHEPLSLVLARIGHRSLLIALAVGYVQITFRVVLQLALN